MESRSRSDDELLARGILRLNAVAAGVGLGLLCGLGLLSATLWLVIAGGPATGQHLGLLSNYFPGYRVSVAGSLLGLLYGLVVGGAAGALVATIYNRLAR